MNLKRNDEGQFNRDRRIPFCIATAGVSSEDRRLAVVIGEHLYSKLTRRPGRPLTFGAGIPVAIDVIPDWKKVGESLTEAMVGSPISMSRLPATRLLLSSV